MPAAGFFLRIIRLVAIDGTVRVALEDDFHHFRLILRHREGIVRSVMGESLRFPWTSCALAGMELSALEGMPLSPSLLAVNAHADAPSQCTHLFDLAGLAIAMASLGTKERCYRIVLDDPDANGCQRARIEQDGREALAWLLVNGVIEAPQAYAKRLIGRGFSQWVARERPQEEVAPALLLRRAAQISRGRSVDLDALERPPYSMPCFTLSPRRIAEARRMRGSRRDFSVPRPALFADDTAWLASPLQPDPTLDNSRG
jgi:hypothetical protein